MGSFIVTSEVDSVLNYTTSTYDSRIQFWLPFMPGRVCAICNNYFIRNDAYVEGGDFVFATAGTITTAEDDFLEDGNFKAGDDIYIKGTLRNDGFYVISTVTSSVITIDSSSVYSETTLRTEDIDDEDLDDNVFIWFVWFPRELKPIVANMIRYDMLERGTKKGINQERIGNYSVSYQRAADIGYNYPDDVIGGLDQFTIPVMV